MTATLEELEATEQTYRKIYESYLQSYTEAVQRQSFPGTNARIISPAAVPRQKSSPKVTRMVSIGLGAGLLAGLGIALLWRGIAEFKRFA